MQSYDWTKNDVLAGQVRVAGHDAARSLQCNHMTGNYVIRYAS